MFKEKKKMRFSRIAPVALLATKAMVATPIKKPTLGAVQGIAVHRLSASVKTHGSTLAVQAS